MKLYRIYWYLKGQQDYLVVLASYGPSSSWSMLLTLSGTLRNSCILQFSKPGQAPAEHYDHERRICGGSFHHTCHLLTGRLSLQTILFTPSLLRETLFQRNNSRRFLSGKFLQSLPLRLRNQESKKDT